MELLKKISLKSQETINSLEKFIQQVYHEEPLTPKKSKENIKKGILRIVKHGKYSSNGLLVTEDGYFLIPKHCIMKIDKNTLLEDWKGGLYELEYVCAVRKDEDIALAKAKINKESKPMKYKIYDSQELKIGTLVHLLCYNWKGEFREIGGPIERIHNSFEVQLSNGEYEIYPDQFISIIQGGPGYSGGTIVNEEGGIVGILSGGDRMHPMSFSVKFFKALELIHFYKEKLTEKSC